MFSSKVFGHPRAFQHSAHEHEKRHGDENFIGHRAENALRQGVEEAHIENIKALPDKPECQRDTGQRKGDGKAHQQDQTGRGKH